MGKSTPSAPPAPDPYATASAQGTSNANTATAQTALNNANQYNPYGSTTFAVTGQQEITNPDGSKTSVPTYTETQSLSPNQSMLLGQNEALGIQTNDIAAKAQNSIGWTLEHPLQASDIAAVRTSAGATPTLATGYNQGGPVQSSVPVQQAATTFGNTAGGIQYNVDTAGIQQARDDATNAALARLQPSMDRDNASLQAQLANQGVTAGSSAYTGAMQGQAQANNDLRLGAVQVGDAEQQALYGQALSSGQFTNAAQQQDFAQQQARGQFQQQGAQENNAAELAAGTFANAAQGQQNAEDAAQAAFGNTAAAQDYQNRLAGATFHNQASAQQLSQGQAIANQEINQISALRSGGQVTPYQGPNYSAGTLDQTPISSDVYATAGLQNQQYLAQLQASAANTAAMGSALGGIMGGVGKMGMKSDRRLKSEVARIATARNGLPIYRYRLAGAEGWHVGMMADEVALLRPDAVWTDPGDGWARVDYERAVA